MILKHRFIGSQTGQWLTVSVIHPMPWLLIPSPGSSASMCKCCWLFSSHGGVLESHSDLDDQVRCREGSVSTGLAPSQQQVGAERSRSPRRGQGSTSELTVHSSGECSVDELGAEVLRMFDSLPSDDLKRGQSNVRATSKSYATGAYVLGGAVGLKAHATERPDVLRVCARFVHARAPGFKFSSVNIFEDVQNDRHKDHWNANLANLAIPLTPFKEGAIFVEHEGGEDVSAVNGEPGTRLRVAQGAVKFNARHCWHHTEEWQARRVILAAFTIRHVENLSSEHRQFLLECGVPLPECAPEEAVIAPAAECFAATRQALPVPPQPSHRSGLVPGVPSSPLKPASALFLEIKCGSGNLSARVRREGFQVLALDHVRPKGRVHVHLVPVDIASASGFSYLTKVVQHDSPFHVHFFPATKSCFNPSYESERTLQVVELLQAARVNYSIFHPEKSFLWLRLRPQQGSRDLAICAGCYGAACPVKMRLHTNLSALGGMPEPSCHCKSTPHASGALAADALYTAKFCDHFSGLMQLAVDNAGLLLQEVRP